jgi:hypothetical protein
LCSGWGLAAIVFPGNQTYSVGLGPFYIYAAESIYVILCAAVDAVSVYTLYYIIHSRGAYYIESAILFARLMAILLLSLSKS